MTNTSINFNLEQIDDTAAQVLSFASSEKIFLFYGEMGAGKTTLIKGICAQLGAVGQANSPTFSIVNEYAGTDDKMYHFDFYRLKNQTEALDMGYEEYFYSGAYCFIEWPEKIPDLLPLNYMEVQIMAEPDGTRTVTLNRI